MILAQEMRPRTFEEVIGNEHIVEPLTSQLSSGTLSQSILITGPTGTGKTTIAYLLADSLSAEIHEIDCGSEGGIDNIRTLIDSSERASLFSDAKMFILDEAHKLTGAAQSALLKTLEDRKDGVYFVLLTNEPEKMLKTVRTRCVTYTTSTPGTKEIGVAVKRVLDKYEIDVEDKKDFWEVIEQAEGSLRQVYSLLEKLISVTDDDGFLSSAAFRRVMGVQEVEDEGEHNLPSVFLRGGIQDVLSAVKDLQRQGNINPVGQASGMYGYLKAAYLGGASVKPEMMEELALLVKSKSAEWIDFERLAWKYLKA